MTWTLIRRTGEKVRHISAAALTEAANTMQLQLDLLYGKVDKDVCPVTMEDMVTRSAAKAIDGQLTILQKDVAAIKQRVS